MNIEDVLARSYFESNAGLSSWLPYLGSEFSRPYIRHLRSFLRLERNASEALEEPNRIIYPEAKKVFAALEATPLCKVKVVIVGQDPYHNGQADGLAFSLLTPPSRSQLSNSSLSTIFNSINSDCDTNICLDENVHSLKSWAEQGVLLLNSVLTVRRKCPKSHYCQGWETFTDKIIEAVSQNRRNVVFLLWGKEAKCKRPIIDGEGGHKILCAPHPASPRRGDKRRFGEANHFRGANAYLERFGQDPICWASVIHQVR